MGDKVGSIYIWSLENNEPKLVAVQENVLEVFSCSFQFDHHDCSLKDDVEIIVSIGPDAFILANGHNQIKVWNLKSNLIEQIRVKNVFLTSIIDCSLVLGQ